MEFKNLKRMILFFAVALLLPIGQVYAQNKVCKGKLKKLARMDLEDIPTNIAPYEDCAEDIIQYLKEDADMEEVEEEKVAVKENISDSIVTVDKKSPEKPVQKKLSKSEIMTLKSLVEDSYDQFIAYYESSGVTDMQKVKEYKRLKKRVAKI